MVAFSKIYVPSLLTTLLPVVLWLLRMFFTVSYAVSIFTSSCSIPLVHISCVIIFLLIFYILLLSFLKASLYLLLCLISSASFFLILFLHFLCFLAVINFLEFDWQLDFKHFHCSSDCYSLCSETISLSTCSPYFSLID